MANSENNKHHIHKKDGASLFKQKQLAAIDRNKFIQKWLFRILCVLTVVLFIIMIVVYLL